MDKWERKRLYDLEYGRKKRQTQEYKNWMKKYNENRKYKPGYSKEESSKRSKDYYQRHKKEIIARTRKNQIKNKDRNKHLALQREFGISLEQYNKMLLEQNNVCAICKNPETQIDSKSKKVKSLAVDHNHETGKVRELLCSRCNTGIGRFEENIEVFENIIKYIKKHQENIIKE